jgi:hypothetical protein
MSPIGIRGFDFSGALASTGSINIRLLTKPVTSRKHRLFDGRVSQMTVRESARTAAAIHRKLRALAAVFSDPAAAKANAERLKARLEEQLPQEPTPTEPTPGTAWTNIIFRLGQGVKQMTSSPPSSKRDWTDYAFRLGKMFRRGLKR